MYMAVNIVIANWTQKEIFANYSTQVFHDLENSDINVNISLDTYGSIYNYWVDDSEFWNYRLYYQWLLLAQSYPELAANSTSL